MREIYLYIICEGESEMQLLKTTLSPHLKRLYATKSISLNVKPINLGGRVNWDKICRDLNHIKQDAFRKRQEAYFSTMLDFYALPKDFPGNETSKEREHKSIVAAIEATMKKKMGDKRFIPYVQLHEFEALVFCDVSLLSKIFYLSNKTQKLLEKMVEEAHGNPEGINREPSTAPSKRLSRVFLKEGKSYPKVLVAGEIPRRIGIKTLKERCPHFEMWVSKLESLEKH